MGWNLTRMIFIDKLTCIRNLEIDMKDDEFQKDWRHEGFDKCTRGEGICQR